MDAQLFKNACSCAIRSKCDRCQLWSIGDPGMLLIGAIRSAAAGRSGGIDLCVGNTRLY